jgi:hypothetical protein
VGDVAECLHTCRTLANDIFDCDAGT